MNHAKLWRDYCLLALLMNGALLLCEEDQEGKEGGSMQQFVLWKAWELVRG